MDKLKLIKTIVFIITFMLVFGSLILLGTIFKKTKAINTPLPEEISLSEPIGSQISGFKAKNSLLFINVKDGGKSDRIVIFDYIQGKKLSTITLN